MEERIYTRKFPDVAEVVVPAPKVEKKSRNPRGLYGYKKNCIQDTGNAGAHVPVTRHPPE